LVVAVSLLIDLLLGGLVATGTSTITRVYPRLPRWVSGYSLTFWLLPALLIILVVLLIPLFAFSLLWWVVAMATTGTLLWFTILAEYHTIDPGDRWYGLSRFWLNIVGYGVAFGFFVVIYQTRARGLLSATGVLLVSGLLALPLLRAGPDKAGRTWLFATVTALVMGQSMWALNYWRTPPLTAAFWLLLIFYLFVGMAQQHLLGRLTRRALIEFATVTLVGLLAILWFAP